MPGSDETRVGHCKVDATDVYIGRGPDGRDMTDTEIGERGWLGNPYSVDEYGRITCINRFRETFEQRLETDTSFRRAVADLHGQTLGCWCRAVGDDGPPCHGDVICEWADRLADD